LEGWKIGRLGTALSSLPIFQQQLPVLKIKIDYPPQSRSHAKRDAKRGNEIVAQVIFAIP
jgi:hypothetical protein